MIVINTSIHYLQSADCSLCKIDNTFHWEMLVCYLNSTVWKCYIHNPNIRRDLCFQNPGFLCSSDTDSFSNMVTACKSEHLKGLQTDNPDIFDFILFSFRSWTSVAEVDGYLHARTSQQQV